MIDEEIWDLVDKNMNVVGTMVKGKERVPNGCYHLTVEIIATNGKNCVLLTRRSIAKFRGAGKLEFPAGSVKSGESLVNAAIRELKEETGLNTQADQYQKIHTSITKGMIRTTFVALIPSLKYQKITLQPNETSDYMFVDYNEWVELIKGGNMEAERCRMYTAQYLEEVRLSIGAKDSKSQFITLDTIKEDCKNDILPEIKSIDSIKVQESSHTSFLSKLENDDPFNWEDEL